MQGSDDDDPPWSRMPTERRYQCGMQNAKVMAQRMDVCIPVEALSSGRSVRPAGRREQVLDRTRVIAQHVALAHPEPPALEDNDAPRLERLGGFVHGLAAAGDAEVGAL